MEAASTSNLVSSETKKTTAGCNFQIMIMNSFFMTHYLMRDQIGSYANETLFIRSVMMAEL